MKLIKGGIAYVIDIHESEEKEFFCFHPCRKHLPWPWHYNLHTYPFVGEREALSRVA